MTENIREDIVSKNYKILQKIDHYSMSTDSFLLPYFANVPKSSKKKIIELCSGNGGISIILREKSQAQIEMLEIQEELKSKEVSSSVGGGAVSVKVNGQKELVEVKLSDEIVKEAATDKEMLEDLILTAVKNAMAEAEEMAEKEMAKVTGGINIPGLF